MKFRDILYFFLLEGVSLVLIAKLLQADGLRLGDLRQKASDEIVESTPIKKPNDDVGKVPRLDLPPFIPGEEVKDGSGRRLRVWSTSGEVTTSSPQSLPSSEGRESTTIPATGSVIIDRRNQYESNKK
jgi:hypothetical protein